MKRLLILLSISFLGASLIAQTSLKGVVNNYFEVASTNLNSVQTAPGEDLSAIQPGSKVLLVQMTGYKLDTLFPGWESQNGVWSTDNEVGTYEFLAVRSVNNITKIVEFSASIKGTYLDSERIQLVTVPEANYITIDSVATAMPWNGIKGGVFALVALKKLSLNDSIDLTAAGFRGAVPEDNYTAGCRPSHDPDTFYFKSSLTNRAGRKGEGIISVGFPYTKGLGHNITGGGGGNGQFAGGAGGGMYNNGGNGGYPDNACTFALSQFARGGLNIQTFFSTFPTRVLMGSGGGSSTQNATFSATNGGNGGGIVFILADTLQANNQVIQVNGESVQGIATAGAGGGGSGGSIMIDVETIEGALNINAVGGDGGSTGANCTGTGGGGSGGVLFHKATTLPGSIITNLSGGDFGTSTCGYQGTTGGDGGVIDENELVLNGFLFNAVDGIDTICQGQNPRRIVASVPKGNTGPFTYEWLQSNDSLNWTLASGSTEDLYLDLDALSQTTWVTRVVTDQEMMRDTALPIKIFVYPAIQNNELLVRDTLCYNDSPGLLIGDAVSGGNGSDYTYQWQSKTLADSWSSIGTDPSYSEGNLTESTLYRRIVTSATVCVDTSAIDTITVLPLIASNSFLKPDTAICQNLDAGTIRSTLPTGGDGTYDYEWLSSLDNLTFTSVPDSARSILQPGSMGETSYYKRIVYSGDGRVCADTTTISYELLVYNSIAQNNISSDSVRYCYLDTPVLISGQNPSNGSGDYDYKWLHRVDLTWEEISGAAAKDYQPTEQFTDTTWYARVVSSGLYNACVDTSNQLRIAIIDEINNQLVSLDENICEQVLPLSFTESEASGGAGIYTYLWQKKSISDLDWLDASIEEGGNNQASYNPPALDETTLFRRSVKSEICTNYSDTIIVTVYPKIESNSILGSQKQFTCYDSSKELLGSSPTGGKPEGNKEYQWQSSIDEILWQNAEGTADAINYTSRELIQKHFFRRIVTSGEEAQCKDTSSVVEVEINPLPTGDIISKLDTLCEGASISIEFSLGGNGPWEMDLGDLNVLHTESGIVSNTGTIQFDLNESSNIKVLRIQDDSLCLANLASANGLVEVVVYSYPDADPGQDEEFCGIEYTLNPVPSVGIGSWESNDGNFDNPNEPNALFTANDFGPSTLKWKEVNWTCADSSYLELVFYERPSEAHAGDDQELLYAFETSLDAETPSIGTGLWEFLQGSGEIEFPDLPNSQISLTQVGEYILSWTVSNGACEPEIDSIKITVKELEVYKGFSPNGDGINDEFHLDFPEDKQVELIIIDSRGNLVRKISGSGRIQWDGRNENGKEIPIGTYYYIIKESGTADRTGFIELRR